MFRVSSQGIMQVQWSSMARLLHPGSKMQFVIISVLLAIITVVHNGLHLSSSPLIMILFQKLYFVPVILAGFWSGSKGGLLTSLIAAFLYPHHGHLHMPDAAMFTIGQSTDIVLLFVVGGMTGWLRDILSRESLRHLQTAEERDLALQEARQSFARAQRAEHLASLGEMAAGIAHEVRNPLTSMQGVVDILRRSAETNPKRVVAMIELLENEIAHLDEVTRHFLQFARLPKANKKQMDPDVVCEQTASLMRSQLESKGHGLSLHAETGTDCRIDADEDQLKQILVNLLLNASQFAEADSVVRLESIWEENLWQARVINRGPEIPPEDSKRIFDPFYTTRAEGTGLGLAIAARIAEAHAGSLEVQCAGGETAIVLKIPGCRL